MKYVSKSINLMLVLRSGISGNSQMGTPMTPGIYMRFKDGMCEAKDLPNATKEEVIKLMRAHSGFGSDFIEVEDGQTGTFGANRQDSEPAHVIGEMRYGHVENRSKSLLPANMTPEMKNAVMEQAKLIAAQMMKEALPQMVSDTIKAMAQTGEATNTAAVEDGNDAVTTETPVIKEETIAATASHPAGRKVRQAVAA